MTGKVGVGVVGCGYWGPNLVRNFAHADGACVVGICDAFKPRAEAASVFAPSAALHTDYAEMLADSNVEACVVATPVSTHYELARLTLEAGKHVLVEKPLATSVEEGESLLRLADRSGLLLMVGHTFVYSPPVRKVKELIGAGAIGELLAVDSSRMNLGIFRGDVDVLWDLAPHDISILMYVTGSTPLEVASSGVSFMRQPVADIAYLDLRFRSGTSAHVAVSWLSPVKLRRMVFVGREGMILYDDASESEKVKVYKGSSVTPSPEEFLRDPGQLYSLGDQSVPALSRTEPLRSEAEDFASCIRDGSAPVSSAALGLDVVRVLEAADASARLRGQRVRLDAEAGA